MWVKPIIPPNLGLWLEASVGQISVTCPLQMPGNKERENFFSWMGKRHFISSITHIMRYSLEIGRRVGVWTETEGMCKHLLNHVQNGFCYSHFLSMKTGSEVTSFIDLERLRIFIHLFIKCLWSAYCVLGTFLGSCVSAVSKIGRNLCPHAVYISVWWRQIKAENNR